MEKNVFLVPSGKAGKQFVREITTLLLAYAQRSAMESVAMETLMVASTLLLQKPHSKADSKEHVRALERRMQAWKEGDIEGPLREGRTIQDQLRQFISVKNHTEKSSQAASAFAKLVMQGKIRTAHRFLSEGEGGRILDLNALVDTSSSTTVRDALLAKHPDAREINIAALVTPSDDPPTIHPVMFDRITGKRVKTAALRTQGAPGPSGIDSAGWRRLCTSFGK